MICDPHPPSTFCASVLVRPNCGRSGGPRPRLRSTPFPSTSRFPLQARRALLQDSPLERGRGCVTSATKCPSANDWHGPHLKGGAMKTWQARDRRCLHACFVTQYSLLNIQYSPSAILTLHSSLYILDCFSSLPAERRAGIFDLISTLCLRGSPLQRRRRVVSLHNRLGGERRARRLLPLQPPWCLRVLVAIFP